MMSRLLCSSVLWSTMQNKDRRKRENQMTLLKDTNLALFRALGDVSATFAITG